MTALAVEYDPLRDKTYQRARLGTDVAAFLAWLELGGASPITVENYERALAVVCRMYPRTPIAEVTDAQLAQVFRRFPARSRRVRVAPYRTFFKWARQTRRVTENPMELIPDMRKPPRRRPEVFTDAEVAALLDLDVVDAAPLAVMFDAGLRRAECCALQLRHCLPQSGYVKVIDGKGGKDRRVPMSTRLQQLLADLEIIEGLGRDDHIFYAEYANAVARRRVRRFEARNTRNGTETGIGEGTFARWWRRCLDDAGVRYRTPHVARHTFATDWRRRGLGIDDIAVVMGHGSSAITSELYAQIEVEDVARRMALIEAGERE
jgi:integrase/recombinase XerD